MTDLITVLLEGVGHQRSGRPDLAEPIYREVLAIDPRQHNALYLYGLLQLKDGRAADAADLLGRAALLRDDPEIQLHLGRACLLSGDARSALAAADEALACNGPRAEALLIRGTALNALHRPEEAITTLQEAARIDPGSAATWLNLGNAHAELDHFAAAATHIEIALERDPALMEAHISQADLLIRQGQLELAITACNTALALEPDCAEAHWTLATALLLSGRYTQGFIEYEWHARHRNFRQYFRSLPGPIWTGYPLRGETLLVHAGQGLGDTIQLARYMPLLAAQGARVVLACHRSLVAFLTGQPGLAKVVPQDGPLPEFSCWVDQMSLPRLLGTTVDTVPSASGYLSIDPDKQRRWAERLPGARIGVVWAGNPLHSNDRRRSLPTSIAQLLLRPGLISLQVGTRAREASYLGLPDLSSELTDFAETAALIKTLDLVITVDTAVAHLAGALGIPTWVMLPHAPDWRWLIGRDTTPWYDTMRLFRQHEPGDWASVIVRINSALQT